MNRFNRVRSVGRIAAVALLGASVLSGLVSCQSQKDAAAEASVKSIADFQKQLNEMPALIDSTMNRLIATTTGQNAKRADDFREFQKDLVAMRSRAKVVASEYEKASRNTSEYFRQWMRESDRTPASERSAIDANIAKSETNRNIALGHFSDARRDFTNLISTLDEVEKSLVKDLSEANVQTMGSRVSSAIMDSKKLRDQIDRLDDAIEAALSAKN